MKEKHRFSFTMFILTMIFFYLPIAVLIIFSFNEGKTMAWSGFSLKWYQKLFFESEELWKAVFNSVIIAIFSSLVSTAIGTLGAIGMYWYRFRSKKYIQVASNLPLIMPEIIMGVSLLIFFVMFKIPLSLLTIFIAHTTVSIPYVLFIVMARLEEFDYSIIEAAYDLGAKEIDTLFKVILPISMPGIISGFLMAVTLSLDDFVITFFVSGPGSSTLPLYINSMIRFGVSPIINAVSVVLIASTILLAVSTRRFYKYMFS